MSWRGAPYPPGDPTPPKKRRGGPSGKTLPPSWGTAEETRRALDAVLDRQLPDPRAAFEALALRIGVSHLAVMRVYAGDMPLPKAWVERLAAASLQVPAAHPVGGPPPGAPEDP